MDTIDSNLYRKVCQGLEEIEHKALLNPMERALLQDAMGLVFNVRKYSLTYKVEIL